MPGTVEGTSIIQDGYSPYKVNGRDAGDPLKQTIQNVGNFSILYTAAALGAVAGLTVNGVSYAGITKNSDGSGSVYLTGFKLESILVSAEQQIDNSKVIPLVNGDSITLTNLCKAGVLSLTASRTAAGLAGGDAISVCDFVRSQGDDGGTLEISWRMNGKDHKMIFSGVCVQRCPPLNMAGNDVPDYPISFTYSNYSDSDSPSWNEAIGSMTTH